MVRIGIGENMLVWLSSMPTRMHVVSCPDRFRRLHSVRVLRNGVKWPADGWGLVYETRMHARQGVNS